MKVSDRMKSLVPSRGSMSGSPSNKSSHQSQSKNNGHLIQNNEIVSQDEMFLRLRREAAEVVKQEPILCMLLTKAGLIDASTLPAQLSNTTNQYPNPITAAILEPAKSFEEIISRIVSHRLSTCSGGTENICPKFLRDLLEDSFKGGELEMGHTMSEAVREDALAIVRRDPAVETLLEAVLFMKGFHSLVLHRAARRAWKPASVLVDKEGSDDKAISVSGQRFVALLLQSQSSSAFGVDIHPAATIGAGVMIDHASGVVIGETATVGDGTTILHGVTLGGTGKESGDRHPKIGKDVLIGAGTKILGNITVGDRAKIGAGSVVLRPIPSGATAVGAPAKIIGYTPRGERPGSSVDMKLEGVEPLLGKMDSKDSTGTLSGGGESVTVGTTDSSGSLAPAEASISGVPRKSMPEKDQVVDEGDTEESTSNEEEDVHDKDSINLNGGEADDGEEDDNVTDFGTQPKCRYIKITNDTLCPFSGSFRTISPSLSQDCISHTKLRALLLQEGCSEGECVEVFFELLHRTPASSKARQCGCIPLDVFSRCFAEVAREKTGLDWETVRALAKGDLRALGMSKKASQRFRSMFTVLGGKQQLDASTSLSRIPSSGSLPLDPLCKSERERMATHLDTHSFAEGITI
mmetsp:Transcript_28399/g.52400  ORF Transcript_28399/g.52400 Transcript_28399/m.52400 type:complete len:635 (-) Transcript_28399:88-1992(-)|eukprot:CAMPEP_0201884736 /NCGR_PEP_ID=MMETSP0902-20130614/17524_1 /ASSEMBLY_ACC=CAM_ASM_000551 /TAXON_ID=420261 /ORGANISM="Thalassiosira antarctica, Strain CCMP982" /LENGTH=634 /DNA_ID=CAMNT_0048413743 /DNA_START=45 /DNA_END=1949 /DNA_ORIENTATION=+